MFQIQFRENSASDSRGWRGISTEHGLRQFQSLDQARRNFQDGWTDYEENPRCKFRILDLETLKVHPVVEKHGFKGANELINEYHKGAHPVVEKSKPFEERRKVGSVFGRRASTLNGERRKDLTSRAKFQMVYERVVVPNTRLFDPAEIAYNGGLGDGIRAALKYCVRGPTVVS